MSNGNMMLCLGTEPPKKETEVATFSKKAEQLASKGLYLSRFALLVSEQELFEAAEKIVPFNTKKNNCWAERMLYAWVNKQNKVNVPWLCADWFGELPWPQHHFTLKVCEAFPSCALFFPIILNFPKLCLIFYQLSTISPILLCFSQSCSVFPNHALFFPNMALFFFNCPLLFPLCSFFPNHALFSQCALLSPGVLYFPITTCKLYLPLPHCS